MASSLWIVQVVGVAAGHILAMKLMQPQSNVLSQGKLTAASGYQQKEAKGYFVLADFIPGQVPHVLHLVQTPLHLPRLI